MNGVLVHKKIVSWKLVSCKERQRHVGVFAIGTGAWRSIRQFEACRFTATAKNPNTNLLPQGPCCMLWAHNSLQEKIGNQTPQDVFNVENVASRCVQEVFKKNGDQRQP